MEDMKTMGEARSSGIADVCSFVCRGLGLSSISWSTVKRMKGEDGLPLRYMQRGKKPMPYIVHEEFYAWLDARQVNAEHI